MRVKTVSLKNVCLLCACSVSVLDEAAPTAVTPEETRHSAAPPPPAHAAQGRWRGAVAMVTTRSPARPRGGARKSRELWRGRRPRRGRVGGGFQVLFGLPGSTGGGRGIREKWGSLGADLRGGGATLLCGWLAGGKPGKMRSLVCDWERGDLLKHRPSVSSLQA